jgi:hypothetical protein
MLSLAVEDQLSLAKLEELVHLLDLAKRHQLILIRERVDAKVVVRVFLVDFVEQLDLGVCSLLCFKLKNNLITCFFKATQLSLAVWEG